MRTTIDMPDSLYHRAKSVMAKRRITFRALVIDALEQSLDEKDNNFVLRDASAGYSTRKDKRISAEEINKAIDDMRDPEPGS